MEFVLKFAAQIRAGGQRPKFGGRELMLLQFAEQLAELLGKTGAARAGAKQFQFAFVPHQQGAQHHHAAFLGEQSRWHRDAERVEDEPREPLERKNIQPRVPCAERHRRATGVRVETSPAWARAEPAAGLPAMPPGRRGFPPDSETSCRCRPDRGENALARTSFRAKTRNRKAIYCQILARVGWWVAVVFCFLSENSYLLFLSVGEIPAG